MEQFNSYLKENVSDEMFEALALDYIKHSYQILSCDINDGIKKYTLQDIKMGMEFFLLIDNESKIDKTQYSADKYMIATKDTETLFLLANRIWGQRPKYVPIYARRLLPFLEQLNDKPAYYFDHRCISFSEHIDGIVEAHHKEYKKQMTELYEKLVDYAVKALLKIGYLLSENDWNRKTGNIKLMNAKGKLRYCHCHLMDGYVYFSVKSPCKNFLCYPNDEKDITIITDKIIDLIKNT